MKIGIYQHYKGNYYQILGVSRHSETLEELVVYQSLYGDFGLWVRPKNLFLGTLMVDDQETQRFKFVSENRSQAPSITGVL